MILPDDSKRLTKMALDTIELCTQSRGQRAAAYRTYATWIETGRAAGGLALANLLYGHLDRLQSYLFSSSDLRFAIDFETYKPKSVLAQSEMVSRILTREWERKNVDTAFGLGVREALAYGASIMKLVGSATEAGIGVQARIVEPWNFGVYNEGINELCDQEAIVETCFPNKHEVWRRISRLPDAERLFKRILSHSGRGGGAQYPNTFMHQVLSTAVLDTSLANSTKPQPGGIVQMSNDPNFATLGPNVAIEQIPMHELWVKNDDTGDWTTIQIIEPDILVAGEFKRSNLFCPGTIPYGLIQPNKVSGYFWGRSEIVDLMQLQAALTETLDDVKRLTALQVDKVLGFEGIDGTIDELYGQMRAAGYYTVPAGGKINDLTPKFPEEALAFIRLIMELMDRVSGFSNILSGQGEAGVRAGNHANTLMRTSSPRLRDRALLVERQCATLADQTLDYLEAKDARAWATKINPETGDIDETSEFLLSQLPDDRRVVVDSHSASPIYEQDHQQLVAFGLKAGIVDGESAIEMLPFPRKDTLIQRHRDAEKAKAELIRQHPELLTKGKGRH